MANKTYAVKLGVRRVFPPSSTQRYKIIWNGAYLWCACASFKYQRLPVRQRTCRHLQARFPSYIMPKPQVRRPPPQMPLFQIWDGKTSVKGRYWSIKYDGVRGYWTGQEMLTRSGIVVDIPKVLYDALPADLELDGELWGGIGTFELMQTAVQAGSADNFWTEVRFMVFDTRLPGKTLEERYQRLLARSWTDPVTLVVQHKVLSSQRLQHHLDYLSQDGHEGLVIRSVNGLYVPGRRQSNLKWKPMSYGTGRVAEQVHDRTWQVVVLTPKQANDKVLNLRMPLHESVHTGQTVSFAYHGLTNKNKPRHARMERLLNAK